MLTNAARSEQEEAPAERVDRLSRPIGVVGTGMYVPARRVTNEELTRELDTTEGWIVEKTGIHERRFLSAGEATSDMCVEAASRALRAAGLQPDDVDVIIVATFTPDQALPSTAVAVKNRIGAHGAIPLDLTQVACAGGIYAIVTAAHFLQNTNLKNALVIGADSGSRITDPTDRVTRVFFGDAAGAVVLGPVPEGYGLLSWDLGDELSYEVEIRSGGSRDPFSADVLNRRSHFLRMNGKAAWEISFKKVPETISRSVEGAGLRLQDIDRFLLHQANINILQGVSGELDIPMEKIPINLDIYGNTASASVLTLIDGYSRNDARDGDKVSVSAIGAGFLWGSLVYRHFQST